MMPPEGFAYDEATFLVLWMTDGSAVTLVASDEPTLDAAVERWVESARTRDTLLTLERLDGASFHVLASLCGSWSVSTPETRVRAAAIDGARAAWTAAHGLDP